MERLGKLEPEYLQRRVRNLEGGPMSFLQKAREAGADASIEKPFETAQLLQLIQTMSRQSAL